MNDDKTTEAITSIRDTVRAITGELGALDDHLSTILDDEDEGGPEPDLKGDARPTTVISTILQGPTPGAHRDYTGQQIGDLWISSLGPSPALRFPTTWPSWTRPQPKEGAAIVTGEPDRVLRVRMRREGHPSYSATTLMEQHLPFGVVKPDEVGFTKVASTFSFMLPDVGYRTLKLPGVVGFNETVPDRWRRWPGGGSGGPKNFSFRPVINSDDGAGPRLEAYLYLGTNNIRELDVAVSAPKPRLSFDPRDGFSVVEVVDAGGHEFKPDRWYHLTTELDAGTLGDANGSLRFLLSNGNGWVETMRIERIRWCDEGPGLWTRAYPMFMFGGRDESFAPQNESQSADVLFRGHRVSII